MKLKNYLMGLLMAVALAACSSDVDIPQTPDVIVNDEARFMTVSIRNAEAPTRGDEYEDGLTSENKVKNVVFYFFNKEGEAIDVINGNRNYFICEGDDIKVDDTNSSGDENVEKLLTATIVLSNGNSSEDNIKDLYSMAAILNYDGFLTPDSDMSLEDLQEKVGNYASNLVNEVQLDDSKILPVPKVYDDNSQDIPYLMMTSSSYLANEQNESGAFERIPTFEVKSISGYVRNSQEEALQNPVKVYVERVVAKVRLSTDWTSVTDTEENVKFGDDTVTAILLKDDKDKPYEVNGKKIYVVFENWGLHGTAQTSRLFKKISNWNLTGWGDGYGWNNTSYCRSFWALNPDGVSSTDLAHFRYSDAYGKIGSSFFYCLENAADKGDGTKTDYDPSGSITNRTQVFIKAKLVTLSDDNKTATVLDLAEWGGSKYVKDDVKTAMLATVNNDIFIRKVENDGQIVYSSIPKEMVKLITGIESGLWNWDTEDDKRYMSYLSLLDVDGLKDMFEGAYAGYDMAFYKNRSGDRYSTVNESAEGYTPAVGFSSDVEEVNKLLLGILGAKVWEGGKTYYYSDLKHLGSEKDKGLYGVVRNHLYDVKINSVIGLGTPVLTPSDGEEEIIIPQRPGQDEFFLGAQVNILSWRIVNNNLSLEW